MPLNRPSRHGGDSIQHGDNHAPLPRGERALTGTTGLVIIGLMMRPKGRAIRVLDRVSVGLVATYAVNAMRLYLSQP